MWNRYDLSARWAAGLGLVSRDEMFTATDNTVALPPFTRLDAAVFCNVSRRIVTQVNLENLFDARYAASAHNSFNITPGAPRTARVTLATRF